MTFLSSVGYDFKSIEEILSIWNKKQESPLRENYVSKVHDSLNTNGKLVGLLFNVPLNTDHPPFGGSEKEFIRLFSDKFEINTLVKSNNSEKSREGKEVFINFRKK